MKIEPLGELRRDPDIEDWFVSKEVPLPYLDGQKLYFAIEGIESDDNPDDFIEAIKNLFSLTPMDREEATPYVFTNYKQFVEAVGEEEFDFQINEPKNIWHHVQLTHVQISRRPYADKDVYVQIAGNCDWEIEHGLQIVFRKGKYLVRVSDQDGHLTTADAYDLPEDKNTILYSG